VSLIVKPPLEWPYWLVIAGALLVVTGVIGALVSPKRADETDTTPDEPIQTPKAQTPPLPKLLDSRGKTATESEVKGGPPA
jgi:hypothetical protein